MDRKQFWALIRTARPKPYVDAQHRKELAAALRKLDSKEIASFEKHRLDLADELYDVRVVEVLWILSGDYYFPRAPRGAKKNPRAEDEKVLEKRLRAKYPDLWMHEGHFD